VASLDSQPSVIESDPDHEFVMVPGEIIRRKGSILKNPNAPVSDCSVLFPRYEISVSNLLIKHFGLTSSRNFLRF